VVLAIFVLEPGSAFRLEGFWKLAIPLDVELGIGVVGALYAGVGTAVIRGFAFFDALTLTFTFAVTFILTIVAVVVVFVNATVPEGGGFLRDRTFRCTCWNTSECDCAS